MRGLRVASLAAGRTRRAPCGTAWVARRIVARNEVNRAGTYYSVNGARLAHPIQLPRPPLLLSAEGPRALRLAARYADVWATLAGHFGDARAGDTGERATEKQALAKTKIKVEELASQRRGRTARWLDPPLRARVPSVRRSTLVARRLITLSGRTRRPGSTSSSSTGHPCRTSGSGGPCRRAAHGRGAHRRSAVELSISGVAVACSPRHFPVQGPAHGEPTRVQQVVQQCGRNRAIRGGSTRVCARGKSPSRASCAAFRKPPVGSSSLPVGSVFSEQVRNFPSSVR